MKKTLCLVALTLALLITLPFLSACGKEYVPASDPDTAAASLRDNGFNVRIYTTGLEEGEVTELNATKGVDVIVIVWYETVEQADAAYKKLTANDNYVVGISDKMVWHATDKGAVKAAMGT